MDPPVSSYFSILSLLPLLSISSHAINVYNTSHEPFLLCLTHLLAPNTTSSNNLIYTPNTTSYTILFQSSIQNIRVLTPTTPKPLLIITPIIESHVQSSVICARKHHLEVRVRSGGHDYEGLSYVSSQGSPFIILDLNRLRSITIDEGHGTAWVQAGATLGELYYTIAEKSTTLGFPAGLCPTVGVGGHFSGGGFGTMVRKYGLAADNIIDVCLVNSNGEILTKESMGEEHFWAIRGGGGASFGVILSYKIKLVQVPPKVTVFTKIKTLSQGATGLVSRWQHIGYKLHEDLFIRAILQVMDDEKENKTIQAIFSSLFLGGKEELLSLMAKSFPDLGVEAEDCIEMSWIQSTLYFAGYTNGEPLSILLDRRPQFNSSFKAKSDYVTEPISEMVWEKVWKWLLKGNERLILIVDPYGGRMDEISENETPFPHRKGSLYNIQYFMRWEEEGSKAAKKHLDWIRSFHRFMAPYVSKNPRAAYLNYRDLDLGRNKEGRVSYSEAKVWGTKYFKNNFKRLAYVKSNVDPSNFFRNEQSIPPLFSY